MNSGTLAHVNTVGPLLTLVVTPVAQSSELALAAQIIFLIRIKSVLVLVFSQDLLTKRKI